MSTSPALNIPSPTTSQIINGVIAISNVKLKATLSLNLSEEPRTSHGIVSQHKKMYHFLSCNEKILLQQLLTHGRYLATLNESCEQIQAEGFTCEDIKDNHSYKEFSIKSEFREINPHKGRESPALIKFKLKMIFSSINGVTFIPLFA